MSPPLTSLRLLPLTQVLRDKRCRFSNCRWNRAHPYPSLLPRGDRRVRKVRCARSMDGCGQCIARDLRLEPTLLPGTIAPDRTVDVNEPLDDAVHYDSTEDEEDIE